MVVVSEPPSVALEAVSGEGRDALDPDPLPNISRYLDTLRARSTPMSPAMSPPAAGMSPTSGSDHYRRPPWPDRSSSSARFGHQRPRLEMGRTCDLRCVSSWSKKFGDAEESDDHGDEVHALDEFELEGEALIGRCRIYVPTLPSMRPKSPARMPLSIDFDEMPIMIEMPNTTSANSSGERK